MWLLILLVLFVMVMFLWLLTMLGAVPGAPAHWLAFFACLILGAVVFLTSSGFATLR